MTWRRAPGSSGPRPPLPAGTPSPAGLGQARPVASDAVTRRRARAFPVVIAVLALVAAGCATRYKATVSPGCRRTATLVLMAQAVPTAERVPCIAALPAGWSFGTINVHNGLARFTLDSDRAGHGAVRVDLRRRCVISGATEIASDEAGTRRYERVRSLVSGYRGTRFYLFPGGCVTYDFNFSTRGQALVNEVSLALGFVTRSQVSQLEGRAV